MASELQKRWILKEADPTVIDLHTRNSKLSPLLARLLALRGVNSPESARRYLSPRLSSDLPSPFLMAGMDAAVDRLSYAVRHRESIAVWGDYDVDGTTGASVLVAFLREIGADPIYYVPHRVEEGYGLNLEGLRTLRDRGVTLVVTVDCGVSNADEIEAAAQIGLDIVVVDHHKPPERLPAAIAVINPHRPDCAFPDKGLCAAGLAFYLVIGLRAKLREQGWFAISGEPDLRPYLDIVTLGTIADMVPLSGVNRTLLRRGLLELGRSTRPGVLALKQVARLRAGPVSAGQVGFQLGPRINAAGRVDYALKVVELLTTVSDEIALRIAREIDAHNRERRAIEAEVLEQAFQQASARADGGAQYTLVLSGAGWHPGVLGIVASRIVERFHRPTVVIGFSDGQGKGSARSIRGFHMVEGFRRCAAWLEKYGGHEYAGGLSIREENLPAFIDSFEEAARACLSGDDLLPLVEIDAELKLADIGFRLMRELDALKPFGVGNPEPVFVTRGVQVCDRKPISTGARFRFRQNGRFLGGVAFGVSERFCGEPGQLVDLAYRLTENEWNGNTTVELKLLDARPSDQRA
ncbi:MAG TPA: single-stranded-DNA-specific exonuclease RecJ [Candidatus Eisenbacteria bacterium]|nr:single-stranded-DNA-specific exonuclease RecJ [Candidatus Eisenbacteria bacterium]